MKLQRRSLSRLALPLKALIDRFAFGILLVLSIALLIVGKADVQLLERASARIGDVMVPALEALTRPVLASRRLVEGVGELVALRAENARLREQNQQLLDWQSAAAQPRWRLATLQMKVYLGLTICVQRASAIWPSSM